MRASNRKPIVSRRLLCSLEGSEMYHCSQAARASLLTVSFRGRLFSCAISLIFTALSFLVSGDCGQATFCFLSADTTNRRLGKPIAIASFDHIEAYVSVVQQPISDRLAPRTESDCNFVSLSQVLLSKREVARGSREEF